MGAERWAWLQWAGMHVTQGEALRGSLLAWGMRKVRGKVRGSEGGRLVAPSLSHSLTQCQGHAIQMVLVAADTHHGRGRGRQLVQ